MKGSEETAESIMLLSIEKNDKSGQFNYPLNGDKPYFWARLKTNMNSTESTTYITHLLNDLKNYFGVNYTQSEGIEPFGKEPMTIYTFKIKPPQNARYELNVMVLTSKSFSDGVNVDIKIPCATKK